MKQKILIINFLILTFFMQGQEKMTYKLHDKVIEFIISQEEIYVEFAKNNKSSIQRISDVGFEELSNNSAILKTSNLQGTYQNRKQTLQDKSLTKFKRIEPVLIYSDGTRQIAKGELNIKLKSDSSINDLLKGKSFTVKVNEFVKDLYLVKLDLETSELVKLVNQLQKNKHVEFIEPNFIRMIQPNTNDPNFASQWAIKNQGYLGGTVDADMDVDEAWSYTTGTGIKIAIIDTGVDLNHPDLQSNLLSGYDATGGGSNGNQTGNAHGTACAGIVSGVANNSIGIAGIAYNAKIIPVKVFPTVGSPTDAMIANGINWAWQNGADVLSNSYGGGSYSSTIANAINSAVSSGRNGKGSVVLFSSGNDNGSVSFPSTVASAISVGASSMCDQRKTPSSCDGENWWGSNYGTSLDLVAPGVKIYTTDISGSAGYSSGNYTANFNGTSSACPNAAGVVALILSANPNLTQQEAREILESNVDKVSGYSYTTTSGQPNGTWNNQVGYGRINAKKAVVEAVSTVWIGVPQIIVELDPLGTNYVAVHMKGANGTNINHQGITATTWQTISSSGGCTASFGGSGFDGLGHGNCNTWSVYAKITATNSYGTTTIYRTITPPAPGPCDKNYRIATIAKDNYEIQKIIEPCDRTSKNMQSESLPINKKTSITVFDFYGTKVLESNNSHLDVSHLKNGSMYIIKANINNEEMVTMKIIK
ncbi:S8 family serine peptidase [Flavobacterium jejuense]|uniref:S8 family serine peptidase n=1 Tax=Flavobacterium jejuense TaxID=1544455 RepID=A0ABX0IPJ7_9FLAO|nr:S8 family serine peptidase [Flavobacterium jejuense]NHN24852.1 S8 family serine peptidase [Flavobacterium jejuense]